MRNKLFYKYLSLVVLFILGGGEGSRLDVAHQPW